MPFLELKRNRLQVTWQLPTWMCVILGWGLQKMFLYVKHCSNILQIKGMGKGWSKVSAGQTFTHIHNDDYPIPGSLIMRYAGEQFSCFLSITKQHFCGCSKCFWNFWETSMYQSQGHISFWWAHKISPLQPIHGTHKERASSFIAILPLSSSWAPVYFYNG